MATQLPPKSKQARQEESTRVQHELGLTEDTQGDVLCRFESSETDAVVTGGVVKLPASSNVRQLELLLNQLLGHEKVDTVPYSFAVQTEKGPVDIVSNLLLDVFQVGLKAREELITLVYTPQAVFKVRSVTRCAGSIGGHGAPILAVQFAPQTSAHLATGSGDGTARIWDCETFTPKYTLTGHSNWVLVVAWSTDGKILATGSMDNTVRLWDPEKGTAIGQPLRGHVKWITALAWEPFHLSEREPRLASSSKDMSIRIWMTAQQSNQYILAGHTGSVTCIRWGGQAWLYSGSQDKTVRIWNTKDGRLLHVLSAHAHWINTMSLSTDFAIRTGPYDHTGTGYGTMEEGKEKAFKRYEEAMGSLGERLVTGSDDFTMFIWHPEKQLKPLARLTGHQKLVNCVCFSPDGRLIASASYDNSLKLWDARDGKGHVAPVYQCAWSSDSRLLVSSSKDTTIKVWDVRTKKLKNDLLGHEDEVFAVDWAPDGQLVGSGGKDKVGEQLPYMIPADR